MTWTLTQTLWFALSAGLYPSLNLALFQALFSFGVILCLSACRHRLRHRVSVDCRAGSVIIRMTVVVGSGTEGLRLVPAARWRQAVAVFLPLLLAICACTGGRGSGITVAGSTSVEPFAERLVELYPAARKGVQVNVQGGGSSAGIRAVHSGICQIGMSSRALTAAEKDLVEIPIALDGIVLIVNRNNPVNELTVEQVRAVFSGEVRNWRELGGRRRGITLITREEGSGTRASFEEKVMYGDADAPVPFARDALVQDSNGAVREIVAADPGAIGYISFGLVDERVQAVALDRVAASDSTIRSGAYPVTRKFLFLTRSGTDSCSSRFIEYVLSPAGQQVLVDEGLVSIAP